MWFGSEQTSDAAKTIVPFLPFGLGGGHLNLITSLLTDDMKSPVFVHISVTT